MSVLTIKVLLRKDLKKVEEWVWFSEQTGTAGAKTVKQEAAWHVPAQEGGWNCWGGGKEGSDGADEVAG